MPLSPWKSEVTCPSALPDYQKELSLSSADGEGPVPCTYQLPCAAPHEKRTQGTEVVTTHQERKDSVQRRHEPRPLSPSGRAPPVQAGQGQKGGPLLPLALKMQPKERGQR